MAITVKAGTETTWGFGLFADDAITRIEGAAGQVAETTIGGEQTNTVLLLQVSDTGGKLAREGVHSFSMGGQTTTTSANGCRAIVSRITKPASIVFPRPTSSATSTRSSWLRSSFRSGLYW
jgi:hypothetical protein